MEDIKVPDCHSTDSQQKLLVTGTRKRQTSSPAPPYWQRHRSVSSVTAGSLEHRPPIRLEDNTEPDSRTHQTLWARSVRINTYTIVRGGHNGIGAYVVWHCTVQTLDGGPMTVRKRYSEFDELREELVKAFSQSTKQSLPPLPPKSAIYKFRPKFLEKRRYGLEHFLNCVLLNPEYASSSMVKEFIFGAGHC